MEHKCSICEKRHRPSDAVLTFLMYLSAGIAVAILFGIVGYVFYRGIGQSIGIF